MAMKAASADRKDFIPYPTNRVVGTVADARRADEAVDALLRAGFERQNIEVLHGEEDLHRLEPGGGRHGFLAQVEKRLIRAFELDEFKHLTHHTEDLRAGRFVIMVLAKRRDLRILAADILHQHGAESVEFYGRWTCEELPAIARTSPEDIPSTFARAWNARNPDALASLFDEDAEFVNAMGLCWHGRDAIRKAYASGAERAFTKSTLSTGDAKVKLLSPDVAVVHARMAFTSDEPAGDAAQAGPHTMIVSFVVRRAGERWMCASVHHTDVTPQADTTVVDESGVFGWASAPSDRIS